MIYPSNMPLSNYRYPQMDSSKDKQLAYVADLIKSLILTKKHWQTSRQTDQMTNQPTE